MQPHAYFLVHIKHARIIIQKLNDDYDTLDDVSERAVFVELD